MNRIAILIPCYNEEKTVGEVIKDFGTNFPYADIYIYDNNSTDNTAAVASSYATTYRVHIKQAPEQGKGNVVKQMFEEIDADIYLLVDGDHTYHARDGAKLIDGIVSQGYDIMLGDRLSKSYQNTNVRRFHGFGNKLVCDLVNLRYCGHITDVMTGYRAMSRKFVNNINISSKGFEVETEMCLHALKYKFLVSSVPITYTDRPTGSVSKLNTISDGLKVLKTIITYK